MAAASGTDEAGDDIDDAAQTLRHQLIYNGEVLDIALDSIRAYKEGTQSLTYLESSVYLAWSLLRMLERWGKGGGEEMYVRKKKMRKRKGKKGPSVTEEGEGVPDVEDVEEVAGEEDVVLETMFTFETFEAVSPSFVKNATRPSVNKSTCRNLLTLKSHGHSWPIYLAIRNMTHQRI